MTDLYFVWHATVDRPVRRIGGFDEVLAADGKWQRTSMATDWTIGERNDLDDITKDQFDALVAQRLNQPA